MAGGRVMDRPRIGIVLKGYPRLLLPVLVTVLAFNFMGDGLRDAADPYH